MDPKTWVENADEVRGSLDDAHYNIMQYLWGEDEDASRSRVEDKLERAAQELRKQAQELESIAVSLETANQILNQIGPSDIRDVDIAAGDLEDAIRDASNMLASPPDEAASKPVPLSQVMARLTALYNAAVDINNDPLPPDEAVRTRISQLVTGVFE